MGNEDLEDIIKELRKHISFLELGSSWGHIEMIIDKALKDTTKSTVESLELEEKELITSPHFETASEMDIMKFMFGEREKAGYNQAVKEVNKWKAKQLLNIKTK